MTLNTDAIRAQSELYLFGSTFDMNSSRTATADYWARTARQLCAALDAAEERAKDRDHLRFRLDVATKDCATLMRDKQEAIDIGNEALRIARDLSNQAFELKTRLDVEKIGLRVACTKRAATREALTKAADALRLALRYAWMKECSGEAHTHVIDDRITDAMEQMTIAVKNS